MSTTGKPFLRALKCAYKLHQAGLSEGNTVDLLRWMREIEADKLPSAGAPVEVIIAAVHEHTDIHEPLIAKWADELGFEVQS